MTIYWAVVSATIVELFRVFFYVVAFICGKAVLDNVVCHVLTQNRFIDSLIFAFPLQHAFHDLCVEHCLLKILYLDSSQVKFKCWNGASRHADFVEELRLVMDVHALEAVPAC